MVKRCDTCLFWLQTGPTVNGHYPTSERVELGECRIAPPVCHPDDPTGKWPVTAGDGFCHQHAINTPLPLAG